MSEEKEQAGRPKVIDLKAESRKKLPGAYEKLSADIRAAKSVSELAAVVERLAEVIFK